MRMANKYIGYNFRMRLKDEVSETQLSQLADAYAQIFNWGYGIASELRDGHELPTKFGDAAKYLGYFKKSVPWITTLPESLPFFAFVDAYCCVRASHRSLPLIGRDFLVKMSAADLRGMVFDESGGGTAVVSGIDSPVRLLRIDPSNASWKTFPSAQQPSRFKIQSQPRSGITMSVYYLADGSDGIPD
jgi:hypothetical protein